jgi:cell division septation protein DedD
VLIPVIAVSAAAVLAFFLWGRGGGESEPGEADRMQAAAEIDQSPPAAPSGERGAAGDERLEEAAAEPEAVPPDAEVAGGEVPRAEEVALPYSVLIASFSSIEDALQRARGWGRGQDVLFYVAPTPVRGVVYYRVLAGILAERGRAAELMADLVRDGIKEQASDWDVRPVRLAFSFGTYPSRRDAEAVVETLASHGVPAYVVAALAADGAGEGYRVFAGGYEEPDDAGPLREQIERAELPGVDVELVERVGLVER